MNQKDFRFYLDQLKSEECYCGRSKKRGFAFCYGCWHMLHPTTKRGLYKKLSPVRGGFGEAFEAAVEELEAAGRV